MLCGEASATAHLEATLSGESQISGVLQGVGSLVGAITVGKCSDIEVYTGSYEVTPTQSTQTLQTQDKLMNDNVQVLPIPSNYGLITWNGSVLTVS